MLIISSFFRTINVSSNPSVFSLASIHSLWNEHRIVQNVKYVLIKIAYWTSRLKSKWNFPRALARPEEET